MGECFCGDAVCHSSAACRIRRLGLRAKDILSGVFFMLTLWAYAGYARSERFSPGRYITVLVFFAMGLMCKPTLVTVPFVLLLLDYWPLGRVVAACPP